MHEELVKFIIKIGTAVGGIIAFLKGLKEYQANNRIKRAEFLEKLIVEFLESKNDIARALLDDYIYVSEANRNASPIEQKEMAIPLSTFLRDHIAEPIRSADEIKVRKSFDNLFDFLTKLSYYLKQQLITPAELSYFKYYLEKIKNKPEVIAYIKRYYYWDDFSNLISAFKF
jgi:hypothetical protein